MKRTWIKIKRGLLESQHREKMGVRIWLYIYMLDIVNWETGIIENWKDAEQAELFGMEYRTLQAQRQQLKIDGYITCEQNFQGQRITIHDWVNPREYSGQIYNTKADGYMSDVTIDDHHTRNRVPIPTENRVPLHIDHTESHIVPDGDDVTIPFTHAQIRKLAEETFSRATGLNPLETHTPKEQKEQAAAWWSPLRKICELCEWQPAQIEELISDAVSKMHNNTDNYDRPKPLTIANPRSILKTAEALLGEWRRNGTAKIKPTLTYNPPGTIHA